MGTSFGRGALFCLQQGVGEYKTCFGQGDISRLDEKRNTKIVYVSTPALPPLPLPRGHAWANLLEKWPRYEQRHQDDSVTLSHGSSSHPPDLQTSPARTYELSNFNQATN